MAKHILRQLERLKEQILELGSLAEAAIAGAITALNEYSETDATKVLEISAEIERVKIDVEEECLKTLALYQPAAVDLRLVVAVLKINRELERIGKLAKNIAKRVLFLIRTDGSTSAIDFRPMASHAQNMVKTSLDALVRRDSDLAHQVRRADNELDVMRRSIHELIRTAIREHPQQTEPLLKLYAVAKHLERIGDMATNIAADIVYMVDGVIIRHSLEE